MTRLTQNKNSDNSLPIRPLTKASFDKRRQQRLTAVRLRATYIFLNHKANELEAKVKLLRVKRQDVMPRVYRKPEQKVSAKKIQDFLRQCKNLIGEKMVFLILGALKGEKVRPANKFFTAIRNLHTGVKVLSQIRSGKSSTVPAYQSERSANHSAINWLLKAVRDKTKKSIVANDIVAELKDVSNHQGLAFKARLNLIKEIRAARVNLRRRFYRLPRELYLKRRKKRREERAKRRTMYLATKMRSKAADAFRRGKFFDEPAPEKKHFDYEIDYVYATAEYNERLNMKRKAEDPIAYKQEQKASHKMKKMYLLNVVTDLGNAPSSFKCSKAEVDAQEMRVANFSNELKQITNEIEQSYKDELLKLYGLSKNETVKIKKKTFPKKITIKETLPKKITIKETLPKKITIKETFSPKITIKETLPKKITIKETFPKTELSQWQKKKRKMLRIATEKKKDIETLSSKIRLPAREKGPHIPVDKLPARERGPHIPVDKLHDDIKAVQKQRQEAVAKMNDSKKTKN